MHTHCNLHSVAPTFSKTAICFWKPDPAEAYDIFQHAKWLKIMIYAQHSIALVLITWQKFFFRSRKTQHWYFHWMIITPFLFLLWSEHSLLTFVIGKWPSFWSHSDSLNKPKWHFSLTASMWQHTNHIEFHPIHWQADEVTKVFPHMLKCSSVDSTVKCCPTAKHA